jgi:hypothetical protein
MQDGRLALLAVHNSLSCGYPTRSPTACIMRPAATFLNSVYATKATHYCRQFGTPLTVIFPRAACELAYSNGIGPLL